jgi:Domain of unknown function (DUF4111)/Nucleotidyltransferase domain
MADVGPPAGVAFGEDGGVPTPEVVTFGDRVASTLRRLLGREVVGVYFVGSVALGGYVPGESDIDIAAVAESALTATRRQQVAAAIVELSAACPTRGLEFTLYRRDIAGTPPAGADFEVNANGGPRMPIAVHLDASTELGFWYVMDRAIAYRSGLTISGQPARSVFADAPRSTLLEAMYQSASWHRAHEKATLYSVLNACRAWRFVELDVLGSKLDGAEWARLRWPETDVIDAAVARRRGEETPLDEAAVDALLGSVEALLREAVRQ